MVNEERGRTMEKDIEDMTIVEYMKYKAEMKRQSWTDSQMSSDDEVDEWFITDMEEHIKRGENEEDVLINIMKSLIEECKTVYKSRQMKTSETDRVLEASSMVNLGTCVNIMPNSVFEYLKLTNLKKTDILVRMANMTQQEPLGTVENVLVKIDKFVSPCDFVVIDMPGILGDMMILGKPFLATIHAQIDVFNGEISFGIGEDRVKFDVKGNSHHSNTTFEKVYMATEKESFNPSKQKAIYFHMNLLHVYNLSKTLEFTLIVILKPLIHLETYMRQVKDFLHVRYGNKKIDDTTWEQRYYEWVAQNYEFDNDRIPSITAALHPDNIHWKKGYVLDDVWENVNNTMDVQHTYETMKDMRKNNFGNVELRKPDMPRLW
ncbi:RNA-directed DNA polymerase, eukaryota, reverse transcriptase zinc-binding domain protein [Tanacetum coccineum]